VTIESSGKLCDDKDYPLSVEIDNNSGRTLESIFFSIAAKRRGRSTDLAQARKRASIPIRSHSASYRLLVIHQWKTIRPKRAEMAK
jgi:hypothetical protein